MLPAIEVRDARPQDADVLVALWHEMSLGAGMQSRLLSPPTAASARAALERLATEPSARLVVGVSGDDLCGLAYLRRTLISPLHDDDTVTVEYLHVTDEARRRGVGKALIAEAVAWAEEKDSQHVAVVASATGREANRFLARLGLGQAGVVRFASTHAIRRRLVSAPQAPNLITALTNRRTAHARRAMLRRRHGLTVTLPAAAPESTGT